MGEAGATAPWATDDDVELDVKPQHVRSVGNRDDSGAVFVDRGRPWTIRVPRQNWLQLVIETVRGCAEREVVGTR